MKLRFTYDRSKDIWCLLKKGKSSNNSQQPTKQYSLLVERYGVQPTENDVGVFIDEYMTQQKIDPSRFISELEKEWVSISSEFQKRAEDVFGVSLPCDVTVYLTINGRCPYSIDESFFFAILGYSQTRRTIMHELWHFYTWHGLGIDQEEKIGKAKYNDLKEALTVLLNVECKDLLPEGVQDGGYPQHQELRNHILEYWQSDRNLKKLWNHIQTLGI